MPYCMALTKPPHSNHPHSTLVEIKNYIHHSLPFYSNIHISHEEDVTQAITSLLCKVYPKEIKSPQEVKLQQFKNGITNKLFKAHWTFLKCDSSNSNDFMERNVLVRIYGRKSELIINRETELMNFISLHQFNLAPPLYSRFGNGLIYEYIDGKTLTVEDLRCPHISVKIAKTMASWHSSPIVSEGMADVPSSRTASLFPTLNKWLDGVPTVYNDQQMQENFSKNVDCNKIYKQLTLLRSSIDKLNSPVVFCHNDLLSANIIYRSKNDEKEKQSNGLISHRHDYYPQKQHHQRNLSFMSEDIAFIDYEYACYNYRGFDIANHFNEWAGFECDYSLYPNTSEQSKWISNYLESLREHQNIPKSSTSSSDIEAVLKEVKIFSLASHLYWGLWALIQAKYSTIIYFDYMNYAILRLRQMEKEWDSVYSHAS